MFVSVMSILQERLPCASFYFRQRRQFKYALAAENCDAPMTSDQHLNFDCISRGSRNSVRSKISHNGGELSAVITAIAQPRMINAWSPSPTKKPSAQRLTCQGSFRDTRIDTSPDFRITKGTGVQSDMNKKLAHLNSMRNS